MSIKAKIGRNNKNCAIRRPDLQDWILGELIRTKESRDAKLKVIEITKDESRVQEWLET